jgi:hypothetical protein
MTHVMEPKNLIFSITFIVWLIIAAIVIGYPIITGQLKVGLNPVSQEAEPQRFWSAFAFSTVLFLVVSIAVGFFVRGILH